MMNMDITGMAAAAAAAAALLMVVFCIAVSL